MDLTAQGHKITARFRTVEAALQAPDVASDIANMTKLTKEHAQLRPVVEAFGRYFQLLDDKKAAEEMLADPSMRSLAEEELARVRPAIPAMEEELKVLLLPKDANDDRNVILEIRAGTGGDEAAIFAGDLFRMYNAYAQLRGWKLEIQDASPTEKGGFKEIISRLAGKDVYQRLKFEGGVHRVQRVPETETQGRVHTSAASVVVLPEAEEADIRIEDKDLRIDTYRSQGAGGQHVNTTDSAVRVTHIPTGVVAACQEDKSQHKNKAKAMAMLRTRLVAYEEAKKAAAMGAIRSTMVTTGERSDKIRTYNFPQNRVTDHRIEFTIYNMPDIMAGGKALDDVMDALARADVAERLAALG